MSEDQGFPFHVAEMEVPSSAALETLPPNLRVHVQRNLDRARRIFRSRTLPCPGSEARLSVDNIFSISSLSSAVDAAVLDGIHDEAALAILSPPATSEVRMRVKFVEAGRGDDRRFEFRQAASLLGKYWYRHQEMDLFDAFKYVDDLKAARECGESGVDLVFKKPPASPRR